MAVPLWWEGTHVGTLIAGQWRTRRKTLMADVKHLEPMHAAKLRLLRGTLPSLAAGLFLLADETRHPKESYPSRKISILRFIELNAARPIRLADLAQALHLSPSRTSHLVREQTGSSFQALLAAERLRKAKALLRSTDLTVAEVGRLAGFENESYFNRHFRARTGTTPGAYRRTGGAGALFMD